MHIPAVFNHKQLITVLEKYYSILLQEYYNLILLFSKDKRLCKKYLRMELYRVTCLLSGKELCAKTRIKMRLYAIAPSFIIAPFYSIYSFVLAVLI